MNSLFRVKKVKVNVKSDEYILEFPKIHAWIIKRVSVIIQIKKV